jgi:hypothetical protein
MFTLLRVRLKLRAQTYIRYNAGCTARAGKLTTNTKQHTVKLPMLNDYADTFWLH